MIQAIIDVVSIVDVIVILVAIAIIGIIKITIFKWKADYLASKIADEILNSIAEEDTDECDEDVNIEDSQEAEI